jgi:hypothetical protein
MNANHSVTARFDLITVAPPVLRLINDLDHRTFGSNEWGKLNTIIRVRIGTSDSAVQTNTALERLWPVDSVPACFDCPTDHLGYVVAPALNATTNYWDFDVSAFTGGAYWVYVQTGWWDLVTDSFSGSQSWEKHMSIVVGCFQQDAYKWATFPVSNHTSGMLEVRASQVLPMGNWFGSSYCQ